MTDNVHEVTIDPQIAAVLRDKLEAEGAFAAAEYAISIGLYPPEYVEGQRHSLSEYWPPSYDGEDGFIVWDVGFHTPEPADEDDIDDPGPWSDVTPRGDSA